MESLAKNATTPGVDAAARLVASLPDDPARAERYPDGTVFVASDLPDAALTFERAIREKKPIAVVFPDGSDVVGRPPSGNAIAVLLILAMAFFAAYGKKGRGRSEAKDESLYFPSSWTTEVHRAAAPGELVAS